MVSFLPNIADDFEAACADFNEPATLRIGDVDTPLASVLSEPVQWKELDPSNAQVLRLGTMFVWSKSRSDKPPVGSIIIDGDDEYWTVWRVTNKQHVETWEAQCLNLNIITAPKTPP